MNNWFEVKVKYTKQQENGSFKRVNEPYILAAMTFGDAEERIYKELGETIRGEFTVDSIKRIVFEDMYQYEDSDVWYNSKVKYEAMSENGEAGKATIVSLLVTANSVLQATERIKEDFKLLVDTEIISTVVTKIVDIFPFPTQEEDDTNQE